MAEPKIDLSRFEISDDWSRRASDLAARGHDLAEEWAGRVAEEARSFARREEKKIGAVTEFITSPTAQLLGAAAIGFMVGIAVNPARKAAVQGAEAISGDWLKVLKAEHRMVEALFSALSKTSTRQKAKRSALFLKIKWALMKHALQEETVIYPALKELQADGMAKHLYADHADMKILLSELDSLPKDDPQWIEKARGLDAIVAHHVREEEEDIFPRFHDRMSPQQNTRLTLLLHREGMKLA